jgi:solute carrier family 35 protein E1
MSPIIHFSRLCRPTKSILRDTSSKVAINFQAWQYYMFLNGIVHFAQNIIAFIILASVSPVTYSIASLSKRVAVICIALVWFDQLVHPLQGMGIGLTFLLGLWMYNNAKGDIARGETWSAWSQGRALPSTRTEGQIFDAAANNLPPSACDYPPAELSSAVSSAREEQRPDKCVITSHEKAKLRRHLGRRSRS